MFGRCALRLRQCIHFARKRGVLSRRSAAGSGTLAARHRQVHAPCEAETWNGHKHGSAKQAHRCGVLGYKGARRKRLAQRNAFGGRRGCEPPDRIVFNDRGRITRHPEGGLFGVNLTGNALPFLVTWVCRPLSVGGLPTIRPSGFRDPWAFLVPNPARSPRTRLLARVDESAPDLRPRRQSEGKDIPCPLNHELLDFAGADYVRSLSTRRSLWICRGRCKSADARPLLKLLAGVFGESELRGCSNLAFCGG